MIFDFAEEVSGWCGISDFHWWIRWKTFVCQFSMSVMAGLEYGAKSRPTQYRTHLISELDLGSLDRWIALVMLVRVFPVRFISGWSGLRSSLLMSSGNYIRSVSPRMPLDAHRSLTLNSHCSSIQPNLSPPLSTQCPIIGVNAPESPSPHPLLRLP
jgi:hypothetical protein